MSYTPFKEVTISNSGSGGRYGSDDLLEIMKIFNGKVVASRQVQIDNPFVYIGSYDIKARVGGAPSAPADSDVRRIYVDSADNHLKLIKSGGQVLDLELGPTEAWDPTASEAISNKTINVDQNTIKHSSTNQSGDLLVSNATSFGRFGLGTANYLLAVNSTGDGLTWVVSPATAPDTKVIVREAGSQIGTLSRVLNFITATDFDITEDAGNDEIEIKIANGAIGNALLATDAVTDSKILNSTITAAKLAGSIPDTKLSQITDKAKLPNDTLFTGSNVPPWFHHSIWGGSMGPNTTTAGAFGIMDPMTLSGTHYVATLSGSIGALTGTTPDTLRGMRTTNTATRFNHNPSFFARASCNDTNIKFFVGLYNSATPLTDDNLDGLHGIGLCIKEAQSTWRIIRNDGSAQDTDTTSGFPSITGDTFSFFLEFDSSTPSISYKLWTTDHGNVNLAPTKEGSFGTGLPGSSENLYVHMLIRNVGSNDRFYERYVIQLASPVWIGS